MRKMDKLPHPVRWLAIGLAPIVGGTVLTACGNSGPNECLSRPVNSPVYAGSPTHKGVVATVPELGKGAIGLDVGFKTSSGHWRDSLPIQESFLAELGRRVTVGIGRGEVQFRFAEVFAPGTDNPSSLGNVHFSASSTEQAQQWSAASLQGVLPAWPNNPTTIPPC